MSIFRARNHLKQCRKALAALESGECDDLEFLFHDWTPPRRRDHGAPFVAVYAGSKNPPGSPVECYNGVPYLVVDAREATVHQTSNSRYTLVVGRDVRDYLIEDIQRSMDYYHIEARAAEEAKVSLAWRAEIPIAYMRYAARISLVNGDLRVYLCNPERWNKNGYAVSLYRITQGEVSISQSAVDLLRETPQKRGLVGMEIFKDPAILGLFHNPMTMVNHGNISVDQVGLSALIDLSVIEGI